jgi:hypothetical protein
MHVREAEILVHAHEDAEHDAGDGEQDRGAEEQPCDSDVREQMPES